MIVIGIGSNLPGPFGSSASVVEAAFAALDTGPVRVTRRSRQWRTRPVPDHGEPWFVNAIAIVETSLKPEDLLAHLLVIEAGFGRTREYRNAPRTLDLDLIDYDGIVSAGVPCLPHPRLESRAFVLRPLADVAPGWRHPASGLALGELIALLPEDQTAEAIDAAP